MARTLAGHKILVTGADGFIGSHLVELLAASGAEVRAFVYYNSWNSIGWLSELPLSLRDAIEIVPGDIRDAERVRQAAAQCRYVFHLSSLIAIPYSYEAPRSYVETNVIGALNVLEACRQSSALGRLIHVSTSEVYGSAQQVPISEAHPLVGQSPYSASKIAADKLAESFHRSFGLPVVTARPFNTFGPRQTARAIIPTIASQLLSGCQELRLGALEPTRDFNYVADTVRALVALALADATDGEVVNVGTGQEWSIGQTVDLLCDLVGRRVPVVVDEARVRPAASEVNRLCADSSRLQRLTGWVPTVPFREGLSRTVDWIRANLARFDSGQYAR